MDIMTALTILRSPLTRVLVITMVILTHILVPAPSASACEECWPVYYEVLYARPSNWITVGQYQVGDVVFKSIPYGRWFVIPGSEHDLQAPFPSCCADGPYFVDESGGLFFVW